MELLASRLSFQRLLLGLARPEILRRREQIDGDRCHDNHADAGQVRDEGDRRELAVVALLVLEDHQLEDARYGGHAGQHQDHGAHESMPWHESGAPVQRQARLHEGGKAEHELGQIEGVRQRADPAVQRVEVGYAGHPVGLDHGEHAQQGHHYVAAR